MNDTTALVDSVHKTTGVSFKIRIAESDAGPEARTTGKVITLFPKFFRLDDETRTWVLYHEAGHVNQPDDLVAIAKRVGVDVWASSDLPYGQYNMGEAYADVFAAYYLDNHELRRRYPQWVDIVEATLPKRNIVARLRIASNDKSAHPTIVQYAVQSMIGGKSLGSAVKNTVKKLSGYPNMFAGSPVDPIVIDPKSLESALWDYIVDHARTTAKKFREGKEAMAVDSTADMFHLTDKERALLFVRAMDAGITTSP